MTKSVYLYKKFERFWHWAQALIIFGLMYTGLEIHGTFSTIGFESAVYWHNILVWAFLVLITFAIFWHFTTGEWRQYVPTASFLKEMSYYYLVGIFKNEPHPTKKTELTKLNPLQRITYFGLKVIIFPIQIISGFIYYYFNELKVMGYEVDLATVAFVHINMTYMLIAFVVVHIYLTTTGHTVTSNLKAMITGYEDLED